MKIYKIKAVVKTMAQSIDEAHRTAVAMVEASETLKPFFPYDIRPQPGARRNLDGAWEFDVVFFVRAIFEPERLRQIIDMDVELEAGE